MKFLSGKAYVWKLGISWSSSQANLYVIACIHIWSYRYIHICLYPLPDHLKLLASVGWLQILTCVYIYIHTYMFMLPPCWKTWLLGVANDLNNSPPAGVTVAKPVSPACSFGDLGLSKGRTVFVWWRPNFWYGNNKYWCVLMVFVVCIGDYTTLLDRDLWLIHIIALSTDHQYNGM